MRTSVLLTGVPGVNSPQLLQGGNHSVEIYRFGLHYTLITGVDIFLKKIFNCFFKHVKNLKENVLNDLEKIKASKKWVLIFLVNV